MIRDLILSPLELAAKFIFLYIHSITQNFGVSLILLSVAASITMMILMQLVKRFPERETQIQKIITPQIKKIRDESKGEERHCRLLNLYERYSYHPIMGLRSIIPFLIQLPFLFAAFYMLSNLELLKGVSFLLVDNLGEPDKLLHGINMLPIIMTCVNITTALITRNFSNREKIQAGAIALLFLILLYNAISSLVIFWTINNLLLLIRTAAKQFFPSRIIFKSFSRKKEAAILLLRKIDYYPFLLGLYPVLFIYRHNIEEAVPIDTIFPGIISLLIVLIIYIVLHLYYADSARASLISAVTVIYIFFYGYFNFILQDYIRSTNVTFFIWFFLFLAVLFLLYKFRENKSLTDFAALFLNILSFTITLISIIQITLYSINYSLNNNFKKTEGIHQRIVPAADKSLPVKSLPDIYYIILDGYAGNECLKEYYNFDNSEFENKLRKAGFFVAGKSKSNYPSSFLSLVSSLNMNYVQNLDINHDESSGDRTEVYNLVEDNEIIKIMKDKSYKYIHFQTGGGPTKKNKHADIEYACGTFNEYAIMWMRTSILSPFLNNIGITGDARNRTLKTFQKLSEISKIKGPKFIFAHLVIPHPPFLFGKNGEDVSDYKMELDGYVWQQKSRYVDQLIFVNKKVLALLDIMLGDKTYRPVIIFQGDHGPASKFEDPWLTNAWEHPKTDMIKERMKILNAYYFPSGIPEYLSSTITPVNSFRVVLDVLFNAKYPLLDDKSYYSSYRLPFKFTDVTKDLNY